MIVCLLFIFMEIFRGNDIAAANHMDGLQKLYNIVKPDNHTSVMGGAVESLTNILIQLDIQTVLYQGSRTPWHLATPGKIPTSENNSATFETISHARASLHTVVSNII